MTLPAEENNELLDGLPIGVVVTSIGRTIGEGEFMLLHTLSWSFSELHTNRERMINTEYGERLLAGPMLTAVVAGLHSSGGHFDDLRSKYNIKFLAVMGIEAKYRSPVIPGDTIWVDTTLESARVSKSQPGSGVMVFLDIARNQRDEVVLEMHRPMLFTRHAANTE